MDKTESVLWIFAGFIGIKDKINIFLESNF